MSESDSSSVAGSPGRFETKPMQCEDEEDDDYMRNLELARKRDSVVTKASPYKDFSSRNASVSGMASGVEQTEHAHDIPTPDSDTWQKAHAIVLSAIQDNPRGLGFVLLLHNKDAPPSYELETLTGIENGTANLKVCWANLGLCVLRLENPSAMLLEAVIAILSHQAPRYPIQYPESYKYYFFYTTGHGASGGFFTNDGYVSFYDIVVPFRNDEIRFSSLFFFFDCCRSENWKVLRVPKPVVQTGECVIYSTKEKDISWGPGGGVSFLTTVLTDLLKKDLSMYHLIESLKKEVYYKVLCYTTQRPESYTPPSEPKDILLMREFREAATPTIQQISFETGGSTVRLSVEFRKPPFADSSENSEFKTCEVKMYRPDEQEITLKSLRSQESTDHSSISNVQVTIPTNKITESQRVTFKVKACYKGGFTVESLAKEKEFPGVAKPQCTSVKVAGLCTGKLEVCWTQESQQELQVNEFDIVVTSSTTGETLHESTVPVTNNDINYKKTIPVSSLKHNRVNVDVTAKRGNLPSICGEEFISDVKSAVCGRIVGWVLLPLVILSLTAIALLCWVVHIQTNLTKLSTTRSAVVSNSVTEMDYGIQSISLLFLGWFVSQCGKGSLAVFCAVHNLSYLSTKRIEENVTASDVFIEFKRVLPRGAHSMPLSDSQPYDAFYDYLLHGSDVTVKTCPVSTRHDNLVHTVNFLVLTHFDGLDDLVNGRSNESFVYTKKEIVFKYGDPCKTTVIPINQSSLVYFGILTNEDVFVDMFSGSIKKLTYSASELGLLTDENKLLPENIPKMFDGTNADSILICSAESEGLVNLCVMYFVKYKFIFYLLIAVIACTIIIVSVLVLCVCCFTYCRRYLTQRQTRYERIHL